MPQLGERKFFVPNKKCIECGIEYSRRSSESYKNYSVRKFCSHSCSSISSKITNKGRFKPFSKIKDSSKQCIDCKEWKQLNEFSPQGKDRKGRRYFSPRCKPCRVKRDNSRYPKEILTRYLTKKSLRHGEIVKQPCIICGSEKSNAHHEDYDNHLDVIWLCVQHHAKYHAGDPYIVTKVKNKWRDLILSKQYQSLSVNI